MHDQARAYVAEAVAGQKFGHVVEIGGRDINGGVRDLFDCDQYTSIDLADGPGVDVVGDATEWSPDEPVDCVVCCEVFEHTEHWPKLVDQAWRWLSEDGWLVVTCATGARPAHSAIDGGGLQEGEWYRNVHPNELVAECERFGFDVTDVQTRQWPQDLYVTARKDL